MELLQEKHCCQVLTTVTCHGFHLFLYSWVSTQNYIYIYIYESKTGAQIPGAVLPWQLNCVQSCLICLGPQFGTSFMSSFWHLKLCGVP